MKLFHGVGTWDSTMKLTLTAAAHAAALTVATTIALAGGLGSSASLNPSASQGAQKHGPVKPMCVDPCIFNHTTTVNWADYSLACHWDPAEPDAWKNVKSISKYSCPNGWAFRCSNSAPGPCAAPDPEPACPGGDCTL